MSGPRFLRVTALLTVLLPFAHDARAQGTSGPLPARVTLDDVLKLLDERSPRAAAERAAIAVAAADRITAMTLPNPTVSYGDIRLASGLSTGSITTHQFQIDQPL